MFGDYTMAVGNLAFLALFALLGLALRNLAREKAEAAPAPRAESDLDPRCFAPAARLEQAVAPPRGERRIASRPVKVERRKQPQPAGAEPPAEAAIADGAEELVACEGLAVRLIPQAPIRRDEDARSWFGGAPEMPPAMPWPKFAGRRGLFLAQICCADLPENLWNGLGPRKGWLAFFVDPHDGRELRALHFAERGAVRPSPAPGACCAWPQGGGADGPRRIDAFPRWPLDIVTAAPDGDDPRANSVAESLRSGPNRPAFDLASREHRPFDWASFLALGDLALAAMARRRVLIKAALPDVEKQLASARKQIELGGMTQAMLGEMQRKAEDLPKLIEAWKASVAALDAAAAQVRTVAEEARGRSDKEAFSDEVAAELMQRLRAVELLHVERGADPERGPGAETIRATRAPLTEHRPEASLFVHDYESLREDWAKHAWCAQADALPEAQRGYFEARWREMAALEATGMGRQPAGVLPGFNPANQTVLVEFVSSPLLKWRFGNEGALTATIDDAFLAQGDFTRLRSQIVD